MSAVGSLVHCFTARRLENRSNQSNNQNLKVNKLLIQLKIEKNGSLPNFLFVVAGHFVADYAILRPLIGFRRFEN